MNNLFEFLWGFFSVLLTYGVNLWEFINYKINISFLGINEVPIWAIIGTGGIILIVLVKIVKAVISWL